MTARRRLLQLQGRVARSFGSGSRSTQNGSSVQLGGQAMGITTRATLPHLLNTTIWAFTSSKSGTSILGSLTHSPASALIRQFAAAALPPHTELLMPALSPTMSQGNIVTWKKKEGDQIQPGDVYCEVETDKATIEWEAQEEGYLAKILMPDGSKGIPIGTLVAVVVDEADDLAAFKGFQPGSGAAAAAAAAPAAEISAPAASSSSGASFPPHATLAMPALSPTMSAGTIISWKKNVGDEVTAGDIFAEVETDKATIEWEAQEDGFIAQILVPGGSSGVAVGTPVLILVDDKDQVSAFASFTAADAGEDKGAAAPAQEAAPAPAAAAPPAAAPKPAAPRPSAAPVAPGQRIVASPYAKKLANEAGVSLSGVGGSGSKGRIVAADVQHLVASGGGVPMGARAAGGAVTHTSAYTDVELNNIKKVTARRLLESKQQIPHYYLTVSCRVDGLQAVRSRLNQTLAATDGGKLSVNDFFIKAASLALRKVPEVNASWMGDFIRQYHNVDCSVAVQTPAGLMVPIIRDSDKKGLGQIATEVKELANKAKEGKLQPDEFTGGTFTISNLGMFGVNQFAAIVNPPQACILAVGSTEKKVVPGATPGQFEEATYVTCTLSCDHRVVDGAVGAQWLQAFRTYIESPESMLL